MHTVRFVQIGEQHNSLIHALRDTLNAAQNSYLFIFEDDIIPVPESACSASGELSTAWLERELVQLVTQRKYVEYPVSITSARLSDEYIYACTDRVACISIADWECISKFSPLQGLAFSVAAILIDRKMDTDLHERPRACPNDLCWDKKEIDLGLVKCEYCADCRRAIYSAVERHVLSLSDVTAAYRILDRVAQRKYCFVIMPFQPEFDQIYSAIKGVLEASGNICMRADEVSQTTSIMDIILDQIGRSSLIVADLTGNNANVFYELGYAHALGTRTILIVQKGSVVPFDTSYRQYVEYDPADLEGTLVQRIKKYLA